MQESNFPLIPKPLLDELNERYPERSAEVEWLDREIWLRAGERRVIRFLNEMYKRQTENILETPFGALDRAGSSGLKTFEENI